MEVYVYNSNFEQVDIVDNFNSCVWTERYSVAGEVKLEAPETAKNLKILKEFNFLGIPQSNYLMLIETVNIKDGIIKVDGTDILIVLRERFFRDTWMDAQGWVVENNPVHKIVELIVQSAIHSDGAMINGGFLTTAQGANEAFNEIVMSTVPPDEPNQNFALSVSYGDLYAVIGGIIDLDNLGIRMLPRFDSGGIMDLALYRGKDRRSTQKLNPVISLDPSKNNITNLELLRSIKDWKNVCYVYPSGTIMSQDQIGVAYLDGGKDLKGWDRRTMYITSSNVKVEDYTTLEDLQYALWIEGINALIKQNYINMVDGQMIEQDGSRYGIDYFLGDILELHGAGGNPVTDARVTEYIRSQDRDGESAYPTLSVIS